MARTRTSELTAGAFVIACLTGIIAVAIWLSGVDFGGRYVYLTAELDRGDVSIVAGSPMKLSSVEVGKVVSVTPDDQWRTFVFQVRLDADVDIRQDAVIETVSPPLGGVGSLTVLYAGSTDAPTADAEHPVALAIGASVQETISHVNAIAADLSEISSTIKGQLQTGDQPNLLTDAMTTLADMRETVAVAKAGMQKLTEQLDPESNASLLGKLHASADNVNQTTADAAAMVARVRPKVEKAATSVASAAEQVDRLTAGDLAEAIKGLRAGSDSLLVVMKDLRSVSGTARQVATVNRDNIDEMLGNLSQASVNLKAATREIRNRPWRLLGKPDVQEVRSENIHKAARAFANGATQLDDAVNRLKALQATADTSLPGDDPQLARVHEKIKDSFEHFTQVEQALWKELNK